jgi:flagellar biosynthesis component FlhA
VVSQIPSLFLVIIITLLIAQLFYSAVGRKKWRKQLLKALAFLLIIGVLLSPLAGLPAWQDGKFVLKRLFNERCPLIQTRWTVKNCQKDSNGF